MQVKLPANRAANNDNNREPNCGNSTYHGGYGGAKLVRANIGNNLWPITGATERAMTAMEEQTQS